MKANRDEIELLIAMARRRPGAIGPRLLESCRAGDVDWERFHRIAEAERVAPIVRRNLLDHPEFCDFLPADAMRAFDWTWRRNKAVKTARIAKTAEVANWFDQRGIRVMLIKGGAIDQVIYEEPWLTTSDDVDLIIDRESAAMPADWWPELCRSLGEPRSIEMDCARHHDLDMNGILDIDYERLWRDARPLAMGDSRVWVMSLQDLMIAACIQFCRRRYSRLKEACAIAEILELHGDLDWSALAAEARRAGADRIVATSLVVVRSLLRCEIPSGALDALPIGLLTRVSRAGLRSFLLAKVDGRPPARRETIAGFGLKFLSIRPSRWPDWLRKSRRFRNLSVLDQANPIPS